MSEGQKNSRRRYVPPIERGRLVEEYKRSGKTQRVFAQEHRIGLSTLGSWIRRERSSKNKSVVFRELAVDARTDGPDWVGEVRRSDGSTVRVSREIPSGLLRVLLRG